MIDVLAAVVKGVGLCTDHYTRDHLVTDWGDVKVSHRTDGETCWVEVAFTHTNSGFRHGIRAGSYVEPVEAGTFSARYEIVGGYLVLTLRAKGHYAMTGPTAERFCVHSYPTSLAPWAS